MSRNLRIVTYTGKELDYVSPESLNIRLNRVADDLKDPSNRFGEYSYTFSLPMTKNNMEIFNYGGAPDVPNSFKTNPMDARLYDDDKLVIDGHIEIRTISNTYDCVFYSKLTQLIDGIKDKSLQDIKSLPHITGFTWADYLTGNSFEQYIENHINADYKNSDEANWQFPFCYYNTVYTPNAVYTGTTDFGGRPFDTNIDKQNYYYVLNNTTNPTPNEFYYHQFPLAWYLKPILEGILKDAGWNLGGSFFENEDIKKIIIPFTGDSDIYDRATYCTPTGITGSTTIEVFPTRFELIIDNVDDSKFIVVGDGQYVSGSTANVSIELPFGYTFINWTNTLTGLEISNQTGFTWVMDKNYVIQPNYGTPDEVTIDCYIGEVPEPTHTPTPTPSMTPIPPTPSSTPIPPTPSSTPIPPTPTPSMSQYWYKLQRCDDAQYYYAGPFTGAQVYGTGTRVEGATATYYIVTTTVNTNPGSTITGITSTGFYGCP